MNRAKKLKQGLVKTSTIEYKGITYIPFDVHHGQVVKTERLLNDIYEQVQAAIGGTMQFLFDGVSREDQIAAMEDIGKRIDYDKDEFAEKFSGQIDAKFMLEGALMRLMVIKGRMDKDSVEKDDV